MFGMIVAALLRIVFAIVATKLLGIPGLLLVGALLLFWVCWGLYREIRSNQDEAAAEAMETAEDPEQGYVGKPRRSLGQALWTITLADVSMSIDNVAGCCRDCRWAIPICLVFGPWSGNPADGLCCNNHHEIADPLSLDILGRSVRADLCGRRNVLSGHLAPGQRNSRISERRCLNKLLVLRTDYWSAKLIVMNAHHPEPSAGSMMTSLSSKERKRQ